MTTAGPRSGTGAGPTAVAVLVLAAAVWTATLLGGAQATGAGGPCAAIQQQGAWSTIAAPAGLSSVTAFAAGGPDGAQLLTTDGTTVRRSTDGGCGWSQTYVAEGGGRVRILEIPEAGPALMVVDEPAEGLRSRVFSSSDAGATWKAAGAGLPEAGSIRKLVTARREPRAFALVAGPQAVDAIDVLGVTGRLFASEDGGATWEERSTGAPVRDMEVDPRDPNGLFVVRTDGVVQRTKDGGRTFGDVNAPSEDWRDIAVARLPADPEPTIVLSAATGPEAPPTRISVSTDGGSAFIDISHEGVGAVGGLVFGAAPAELYAAAGSAASSFRGPGLRRYVAEENRWEDIDGPRLRSLRDPISVEVAGDRRGSVDPRAIFARRDSPDTSEADAIARYDPPAPPVTALQPNIKPPAPCDTRPYTPPPGRRTPAIDFGRQGFDLQLEPGVPRREDLRAKLPPVPTPIDVHFVLERSTSMRPSFAAVTCAIDRIQRELAENASDAHFGLAVYSDLDERYNRVVDLQPLGREMHEDLRNLGLLNGRGEPMRSAIFQSLTGAGVYRRGENPAEDPPIELVKPGQAVKYRDDALKTMLTIVNEPYKEDLADEPRREVVTQALREADVKFIGLPVFNALTDSLVSSETGPAAQAQLRTQLDFFARDSNSYAPKGGVDCDGNGQPDLPENEPLICPLNVVDGKVVTGIADAVLSILRGLQDVQRLRLIPRSGSGLDVGIEGGDATVDVTKPSALAGVFTVSCTAAQAGRRFPLAVDVVAGKSRVIATLAGTATCGTLPAAAVPRPQRPRVEVPALPAEKPVIQEPTIVLPNPPPPITPQPAVALAVPPPPPSPVPIASGAPSAAPSPSSSPAPSASPSPSAGMAANPQKRAQLRTAKVRDDKGSGEHSMRAVARPMLVPVPHRRDHRGPTPLHAAMVTLGLGACSAFGYVAVASTRTRRRFRVVEERYGRR